MTQKIFIFISMFIISACHPQLSSTTCPISADEILSCVASSTNLSPEEITTKFDSLSDVLTSNPNSRQLNKMLCFSLHNKASLKQLQKGKAVLIEKLNETECRQQSLSGLLLLTQGHINLRQKYLDKNWNLYLKKKKTSKEQETEKLEIDNEIISYQRRIKDLEQQVQKLKEIESMLDNKPPQ